MSVASQNLELETPATLADALSLLASGAHRPFAGGTDLMVELATGRLRHTKFVSLHRIPELRGIVVDASSITIGATTPYSDLLAHEVVAREFPSLREAAALTGARAIQNRGTLGGNIGNASPAADSPPALLSYDAEVELLSARGGRWVPYETFHTGYKTTLLAPGEIVSCIRLPRPAAGLRHYYRKVGARRALAISKLCVAASALPRAACWERVRIALGSVAPTVIRLRTVEALVEGNKITVDLIARCKDETLRILQPIDDVRSTAEYRAGVAANLVEEFLEGLR